MNVTRKDIKMFYQVIELNHTIKSTLAESGKTQGSTLNHQQNPKDTDPFDITRKQVKSHLRYLWGLQEPGFRSHEGKGGIHSYSLPNIHSLDHSSCVHKPSYNLFILIIHSLSVHNNQNSKQTHHNKTQRHHN
jgi:hypothetical protein